MVIDVSDHDVFGLPRDAIEPESPSRDDERVWPLGPLVVCSMHQGTYRFRRNRTNDRDPPERACDRAQNSRPFQWAGCVRACSRGRRSVPQETRRGHPSGVHWDRSERGRARLDERRATSAPARAGICDSCLTDSAHSEWRDPVGTRDFEVDLPKTSSRTRCCRNFPGARVPRTSSRRTRSRCKERRSSSICRG